MTRAALLGAVMGLLLGGAILAVLALQLSVVDMPGEGAALARPDATDPQPPASEEDTVKPAEEQIVGPAPEPAKSVPREGPAEIAPRDIARLAAAVGTYGAPAVVDTQNSAPPVPPQMTPLAESAGMAMRSPAIAEVLAAPPLGPNAIRGFRPARRSGAVDIVAITLPVYDAPLRRTDHARAARGETPSAIASVIATSDPVLAQSASANAAAVTPQRTPVRLGVPATVSVEGSATALPAQTAMATAPRLAPIGVDPTPRTNRGAPQADPDRRAGTERPAMILWLVTDVPADAAAPDWAVALGAADASARVVALPPLDQPEALAGFTTGEGREARALVLRRELDWPAVLLAPVLELPALREIPVLYPRATAPDTVDLLRGRDPRSMPVYAVLNPAAPRPATEATLAAAAKRAGRDGLVVIEMSADPALLEVVTAWQNGPGAGLEPARLSDLFGG